MDPLYDRGTTLPGSEAFAAMLYPVRVAFLKSMPAHIKVFEAFLDTQEHADYASDLQELAARAHKIAGVAETLSFRDLGRMAATFEAQVYANAERAQIEDSAEAVLIEMIVTLNH